MAVVTDSELAHRFAHHPPRSERVLDLHAQIRRRCLDLAEYLNHELPSSPEAAKAIDLLDDACMHANAAVARHANQRRGAR